MLDLSYYLVKKLSGDLGFQNIVYQPTFSMLDIKQANG